jgi:hypothetical protein
VRFPVHSRHELVVAPAQRARNLCVAFGYVRQQLRAVAHRVRLDLPEGGWNAAVHGARGLSPLTALCADIFAAFRVFETLPFPRRGAADDAIEDPANIRVNAGRRGDGAPANTSTSRIGEGH